MRHLLGSGRPKDHSFTVAVFKHVFRFFLYLGKCVVRAVFFPEKKNEGVLGPS